MKNDIHHQYVSSLRKKSHNDTVLFRIQYTKSQTGMTQDETGENAPHILDGISYCQKVSYISHNYPLAAVTFGFISNWLPSSSVIPMRKILFPQIQVVFLSHKSHFVILCSHPLFCSVPLYQFTLSEGLFAISSVESVISMLITSFF